MNIVYYLGAFPKLSESFVLNEIYELEQNGHNVAVCALNDPNEDVAHQEFEELDIPIYYIPKPSLTDGGELASMKALSPRILKDALHRSPVQTHAANLFRCKKCVDFVDSLPWTPDHFHSHFATRPTFGVRYAANYYQVPCTVTAHAYDLYKATEGRYTTNLLRSVDKIITISEYNRQQIRQRFAPTTPIDVVHAGIRPKKFTPTDRTEPNRVLTVARFVEKKGLTYALEAIKFASKKRPELEYHVIGSGELEPILVKKTDWLGIDENVVFLDNVSDQQLLAELDTAACFLLPCVIADSGDRDGIPVAIMEAMAMKSAPVSTTVSGIPELIDHEQNGLLTEPRNPEATGKALLSLLEDDSKRAVYAERARQKVTSDFNVETEAEKLEAAFRTTRSEDR